MLMMVVDDMEEADEEDEHDGEENDEENIEEENEVSREQDDGVDVGAAGEDNLPVVNEKEADECVLNPAFLDAS